MSQSGERFSTIKILLELACAAVGFAMSLLFARQLGLGSVPGVFMGLMGAIFAFILAQGFTTFIFRILRRD
jgi:positive regulator of sigma E activity